MLVAVIDQYEENVAQKSAVPTQFIERLSLLDRGELRGLPILFGGSPRVGTSSANW